MGKALPDHRVQLVLLGRPALQALRVLKGHRGPKVRPVPMAQLVQLGRKVPRVTRVQLVLLGRLAPQGLPVLQVLLEAAPIRWRSQAALSAPRLSGWRRWLVLRGLRARPERLGLRGLKAPPGRRVTRVRQAPRDQRAPKALQALRVTRGHKARRARLAQQALMPPTQMPRHRRWQQRHLPAQQTALPALITSTNSSQ